MRSKLRSPLEENEDKGKTRKIHALCPIYAMPSIDLSRIFVYGLSDKAGKFLKFSEFSTFSS